MSDAPVEKCRALAPIMPRDTGPNYCSLPKGHDGNHYVMGVEVPEPYRNHRSYGTEWPKETP